MTVGSKPSSGSLKTADDNKTNLSVADLSCSVVSLLQPATQPSLGYASNYLTVTKTFFTLVGYEMDTPTEPLGNSVLDATAVEPSSELNRALLQSSGNVDTTIAYNGATSIDVNCSIAVLRQELSDEDSSHGNGKLSVLEPSAVHRSSLVMPGGGGTPSLTHHGTADEKAPIYQDMWQAASSEDLRALHQIMEPVGYDINIQQCGDVVEQTVGDIGSEEGISDIGSEEGISDISGEEDTSFGGSSEVEEDGEEQEEGEEGDAFSAGGEGLEGSELYPDGDGNYREASDVRMEIQGWQAHAAVAAAAAGTEALDAAGAFKKSFMDDVRSAVAEGLLRRSWKRKQATVSQAGHTLKMVEDAPSNQHAAMSDYFATGLQVELPADFHYTADFQVEEEANLAISDPHHVTILRPKLAGVSAKRAAAQCATLTEALFIRTADIVIEQSQQGNQEVIPNAQEAVLPPGDGTIHGTSTLDEDPAESDRGQGSISDNTGRAVHKSSIQPRTFTGSGIPPRKSVLLLCKAAQGVAKEHQQGLTPTAQLEQLLAAQVQQGLSKGIDVRAVLTRIFNEHLQDAPLTDKAQEGHHVEEYLPLKKSKIHSSCLAGSTNNAGPHIASSPVPQVTPMELARVGAVNNMKSATHASRASRDSLTLNLFGSTAATTSCSSTHKQQQSAAFAPGINYPVLVQPSHLTSVYPAEDMYPNLDHFLADESLMDTEEGAKIPGESIHTSTHLNSEGPPHVYNVGPQDLDQMDLDVALASLPFQTVPYPHGDQVMEWSASQQKQQHLRHDDDVFLMGDLEDLISLCEEPYPSYLQPHLPEAGSEDLISDLTRVVGTHGRETQQALWMSNARSRQSMRGSSAARILDILPGYDAAAAAAADSGCHGSDSFGAALAPGLQNHGSGKTASSHVSTAQVLTSPGVVHWSPPCVEEHKVFFMSSEGPGNAASGEGSLHGHDDDGIIIPRAGLERRLSSSTEASGYEVPLLGFLSDDYPAFSLKLLSSPLPASSGLDLLDLQPPYNSPFTKLTATPIRHNHRAMVKSATQVSALNSSSTTLLATPHRRRSMATAAYHAFRSPRLSYGLFEISDPVDFLKSPPHCLTSDMLLLKDLLEPSFPAVDGGVNGMESSSAVDGGVKGMGSSSAVDGGVKGMGSSSAVDGGVKGMGSSSPGYKGHLSAKKPASMYCNSLTPSKCPGDLQKKPSLVHTFTPGRSTQAFASPLPIIRVTSPFKGSGAVFKSLWSPAAQNLLMQHQPDSMIKNPFAAAPQLAPSNRYPPSNKLVCRLEEMFQDLPSAPSINASKTSSAVAHLTAASTTAGTTEAGQYFNSAGQFPPLLGITAVSSTADMVVSEQPPLNHLQSSAHKSLLHAPAVLSHSQGEGDMKQSGTTGDGCISQADQQLCQDKNACFLREADSFKALSNCLQLPPTASNCLQLPCSHQDRQSYDDILGADEYHAATTGDEDIAAADFDTVCSMTQLLMEDQAMFLQQQQQQLLSSHTVNTHTLPYIACSEMHNRQAACVQAFMPSCNTLDPYTFFEGQPEQLPMHKATTSSATAAATAAVGSMQDCSFRFEHFAICQPGPTRKHCSGAKKDDVEEEDGGAASSGRMCAAPVPKVCHLSATRTLNAGGLDASSGIRAGGKPITKELLEMVYNLPIEEAAAKLSIGVTVLKKHCRQFDVVRWPYRKLTSIDKLMEIVRADSRDHPEMMATAASLLSRLQATRDAICLDPGCEIPDEIRKLRQANFKNEYKQRQQKQHTNTDNI
ncbi:hypothetical protein CEUSTIGMA_g7927.t1 [Chlamydomonas eustigma]|uniref:RWP-RK domain-containing protein n=1 Tax=Chlamydomonas eustigma TaxID=1157962 RepID=A0A250XC62_9CHLO|nr:hypothetical protein CEUSTIGMA_g7927.t1 [Chlamydomonas eustigma]|eukprot:GAX80489.1 hypothetical protein CEUSTIGMA_g7927.t1 [Chlamydomonas eustigma]